MGIFNHKRIAELEEKLRDSERSRDRYKVKASELAAKLEVVSKLEETIPEGCVKGPWCKACEFAKTIHFNEHYGPSSYNTLVTMYVCSKGESCKNFVQKEIKDD